MDEMGPGAVGKNETTDAGYLKENKTGISEGEMLRVIFLKIECIARVRKGMTFKIL